MDPAISKPPKAKLCVLGPIGAGKTSLIHRTTRHIFDPEATSTIAVSWLRKEIQTSKGPVTLELWDTAGQERFSDVLTPMFCRRAEAVLLIYDSSSQDSCDRIQHWLDYAKANMSLGAVIVVVATKQDLLVNSEPASPPPCIETDGFLLFQCSSKTAEGVEEIFQQVGQEVMNRRDAGLLRLSSDEPYPKFSAAPNTSSGCYCWN